MRTRLLLLSALLLQAGRAPAQISTDALLDTVQRAAFNFFWYEANPANGLIKDRSTAASPSSIASVGFGLSAICIGADHGWVTREAARDRVLTTLNTFWRGPQGGGTSGYIGNFGLFYHFLTMDGAERTWDCELSTIDTGLLLAGIIDARQYFDRSDSVETRVRNLADSIYYRMNWNLMRNFNPGILMGWKPGTGFLGFGQWVGYNEASIMYILALGSPTFPVDYDAWLTWVQGYDWATYYGYSYVRFAPLFGHQYSHCWIDFRGIADDYMRGAGIDYFENSRRATLAQRAYSIANPSRHAGYGDTLWGITASDTPTGYRARGAPPPENDDGTIAPTAPVSSIPFAPAECIRVMRTMWDTYGPALWTPYGFRDAFNLNVNWWDRDIIGIDQGPMIIMIENYRTGRVWQRFMRNPDVRRGLDRARFRPVTGVKPRPESPEGFRLHECYPNPFNPATTIEYSLASAGPVTLKVYDALGREMAVLVDEELPAGSYAARWDASGAASGVYVVRLQGDGNTATVKTMLLR